MLYCSILWHYSTFSYITRHFCCTALQHVTTSYVTLYYVLLSSFYFTLRYFTIALFHKTSIHNVTFDGQNTATYYFILPHIICYCIAARHLANIPSASLFHIASHCNSLRIAAHCSTSHCTTVSSHRMALHWIAKPNCIASHRMVTHDIIFVLHHIRSRHIA